MITFTEAAKKKLELVYRDEGYEGVVHLRVGVRGGGCAGFKNTMFFDECEPSEFDQKGDVIENIIWVCDPLSLQYLEGTTIDHVTDLMKEGFVFSNDKISATCGCGNSIAY